MANPATFLSADDGRMVNVAQIVGLGFFAGRIEILLVGGQLTVAADGSVRGDATITNPSAATVSAIKALDTITS